MQLLINAPRLTSLVQESIDRYVRLRFEKLTRFLPTGTDRVRITAQQERHNFIITVEIRLSKPVFIQVAHSNLYAAIDQAYDIVKRSVNKYKDKRRR